MTRYIDADALSEALMTRWNTADKNAEKIISSVMADIVTPIVVGMPTIDAVEVVRCENCKYGSEDYPKDIFPDVTEETYSCDRSTYCHDKDFYCKYGERRDHERE